MVKVFKKVSCGACKLKHHLDFKEENIPAYWYGFHVPDLNFRVCILDSPKML